jgi:gamma-glutamylputrescine oxidase
MQFSSWEKESFLSPSDVIIAGSGFVGLWSAYYLKKKQPRLRITIVDSGFIPSGASTRNAGFACFGSVTELMKDVFSMGEEHMLSLVEMRFKGLRRIKKLFGKAAEYSTCGGYELIPAIQQDRYSELREQLKWLNHRLCPVLKKNKVFRFDDDRISEFGFAEVSHVISNKLEGYLHPGKLCAALLNKVQGMGVTYIPATEINHIEETSNGVTIFTSRNFTLYTDQLLVCTNGFAKQLLPQLDVVPVRGQVLLTAPIRNLRIKGTFHYDEGYYYFRNVGKRLLLGGARNLAIEEETTTEMNTSELIQQTLEKFIARHLLPGTPFQVTDRWGGIMGMGAEKIPIVKKVSTNVYCAVRMSGMGVALAPIAADQVSDLMRR